MAEEEQLLSLMFLLTYVLQKRRRDINDADVQRRSEIQRRIRHRQYFFQRQRRMLLMMIAGGIRSNVRIRTRPWTTTASTDWWERVVMTEFQPSDWLDKFRMSQETFFHLCDKLRPRLARQDTSFRLALPVEKRVAVALWRLASNIEYRTISTLFGVGKSTVCRCVRDMCHAIVGLLSSIYLRPPNEQELEDSAQLFLNNVGFPHCVAAIATLHTAIITPSNNASDYANPAGWFSVLSQVAVSGRGQFWDVCASFPGGTDPAEILQSSSLWTTAAEGGLSPAPLPVFMGRPLRYVLLGEACYPLQSWLMKPYPEQRGRGAIHAALTEPQRLFNRRLSRARRVSDEALLRLRARWQCLSKRNDCGLDVVPTMILACCILHNICESHGDAFTAEWLAEVAQSESPQPSHKQLPSTSVEQSQGEEVRHLFSDYFQHLNI
ncbi:protein ANTAGONIST OF LIKE HETEROCHROMATIN PROTEIN 1 [Hippoglossus stenolepis]|uniref:protein ANTAGONIST OF LIKE HETEROCHROMATIN PROTEIN 1 n=1 Tax=Hippoglossus stenolepis TaxID=195615 RepID=UPI00159C986F|nr:protein ANTAGONIST OF LIKE HETEROCHROMATIN PROTEIN 1 [Hippoglossus stenolepis]